MNFRNWVNYCDKSFEEKRAGLTLESKTKEETTFTFIWPTTQISKKIGYFMPKVGINHHNLSLQNSYHDKNPK